MILIAHSLGCITVAHWAQTAPLHLLRQVRGALLVAPADVERPPARRPCVTLQPIPTDLLPFPSQIVASDNDAAVSAPADPGNWPATGARKRASSAVPGISM